VSSLFVVLCPSPPRRLGFAYEEENRGWADGGAAVARKVAVASATQPAMRSRSAAVETASTEAPEEAELAEVDAGSAPAAGAVGAEAGARATAAATAAPRATSEIPQRARVAQIPSLVQKGCNTTYSRSREESIGAASKHEKEGRGEIQMWACDTCEEAIEGRKNQNGDNDDGWCGMGNRQAGCMQHRQQHQTRHAKAHSWGGKAAPEFWSRRDGEGEVVEAREYGGGQSGIRGQGRKRDGDAEKPTIEKPMQRAGAR